MTEEQIRTVAVEGYRSLRQLVLPLGRLTVVTGANGVGKSSLYRALRLLAEVALGGAIGALAREGGLPSTLWAGPEVHGRAVREGLAPVQGTMRTGPVALRLGFAGDDLGYAIDMGLPLPQRPPAPFGRDPEIKVESVWAGQVLRPGTLVAERRGPAVRLRDPQGEWAMPTASLRSFDSLLTEVVDPAGAPELVAVRERLRSWRFYDQFRTDPGAPARAVQVGTRTPVLAHDGSDLAAALETVRDLGRGDELDEAVARAFPGARLEVTYDDGRFEVTLRQHGLLRPLRAAELSDGTLRYLLWVAALLSPRPPRLLVINEPETSLHPELLPALAALVAHAATVTQVLVVTHSRPLVEALGAPDVVGQRGMLPEDDVVHLELVKDLGATVVAGREGPFDQPAWHWPRR